MSKSSSTHAGLQVIADYASNICIFPTCLRHEPKNMVPYPDNFVHDLQQVRVEASQLVLTNEARIYNLAHRLDHQALHVISKIHQPVLNTERKICTYIYNYIYIHMS